ncbi:MAG: aldehyde dehydrogenase family protein [Cyclobacteriaceae bacterium]|jgi:aldehyde dehydrogenase (NAD+)|nr:aldehyde dehydrogenase family protein [Cyclobacteriaceae bacterium]MDH4298731.1 aldehyde dehydrogenase family protein [Cyclobacteriaceae bacterium]MDH5250870.1 aldehyde dehydrogenase family protein [Cyclobacteriaceae bacterium]
MILTEVPPTLPLLRREVERIFKLQKANQQKIANSTARDRKQKLDLLHQAVLKYRDDIRSALHKDFKKHPSEVDIAEIFPVTSDIKHTQAHLSKWMRPKKVATPMAQLGSSSYIHYEPKGVVLIISTWNFPVNITFGPLVSAIAAGNCVIMKPSEHTPHASAIMKKIIDELFDEAEVALIEGDVDVSTELLKLPFNHIFFTGAPEIGKVIMKAAAEHLASVTLELGGKSPTIVDNTANLKDAAHRITFGKWMNNGQVCIAPDHVFVDAAIADEFLDNLKTSIRSFYGAEAAGSGSYNRIVNQNHFKRIVGYFEDALSKGAKIEYGGKTDASQDYFGPTIMSNIPKNSDLSEKEIFGPILPFYTYTDLQEVIDNINTKEKPLALYIYSNSTKNIKRIINNTRAGGTCVNQCGIHFFNNYLPFGGSNNSGIGKGNGFFGFEAFSNARAVLRQWSPMSGLDFMTPPYTDFKQKLIDFTIKWF